jgi:hypothetical protein
MGAAVMAKANNQGDLAKPYHLLKPVQLDIEEHPYQSTMGATAVCRRLDSLQQAFQSAESSLIGQVCAGNMGGFPKGRHKEKVILQKSPK